MPLSTIASFSLLTITRLYPLFANSSEYANPIPELAPVIKAHLFSIFAIYIQASLFHGLYNQAGLLHACGKPCPYYTCVRCSSCCVRSRILREDPLSCGSRSLAH
ncbi:secreted protein [gut metagenome]|uniref:Secreted protein n=1 Tax=gut metagenome TaxID=749906 RepID=J9FXN7_9ZZZZ